MSDVPAVRTFVTRLAVGYDGSPPARRALAAATGIRDANPDRFVAIVGSSSSAIHRVAGSVAVGLGRHPPVPLLIVP
jgi:hypothetical protein